MIRFSFAVLLLSAAGCGGSEPPAWLHLTDLGGAAGMSAGRSVVGEIFGQEIAFVRDERGTWLETALTRDQWALQKDGAWTARSPLRGRGQPDEGAPEELFSAKRRFERSTRGAVAAGNFPLGHFVTTTERGGGGRTKRSFVILRLAPNKEPPARTTLRVFATSQDPVNAGRIAGSRLSGEGFVAWPGNVVERTVDVPANSVLRFATSFDPALLGAKGATKFRVLLDGEEIYSHVEKNALGSRVSSHTVPLTAGKGARLGFEVTGNFGYTAFHVPVIGPAEIGTYAERPWGKGRPNVVVFLADTFRADNMASYGSELPLTPFLDELASKSLFFSHAWSVATYTMPAHAALFTGLYARQTGATTTLTALPEEVSTIAERFRERGYRTGAVTDAVVVSHENNLDQGFEWFDELHGKIEDTYRRLDEFLDADDGRPMFLFLQTYRAHTPYIVTEETRKRLADELEIAPHFNALSAELQLLAGELGLEGDLTNLRKATKDFYVKIYEEKVASKQQVQRYEETIARLEAMYRAGAADLDIAAKRIHGDLIERGILDDSWFLFMSDHGEAFNEHDKVFHGGKVWYETTQIPMFLTGPGVRAGTVDFPVSLVDVAPTLAQIGGLDGSGYLGTSMLEIDRERPIFTFENQGIHSTFAVIDQGRKVMGYELEERRDKHELFAAFDLENDPRELNDLATDPPEWASELLQELTPFVRDLSTARYGAKAAPVNPEREDALRALGYGGG